MVVLGRHMRLQKGIGAVKVGKPFFSRQGKLEKGFVPCNAANPSGQRKKPSQTAALTEVSGATRFHASLLLLILAGTTHMPSPHLCYTCTIPFTLYWVGSEKKARAGPKGQKPLSQQKVTSRSSLFYFPAFLKGCENLKNVLKRVQDFPLIL